MHTHEIVTPQGPQGPTGKRTFSVIVTSLSAAWVWSDDEKIMRTAMSVNVMSSSSRNERSFRIMEQESLSLTMRPSIDIDLCYHTHHLLSV